MDRQRSLHGTVSNPAVDQLAAELEGSRHEASIAGEPQVADWRPTQRHLRLGPVGTVPATRGRGFTGATLMPMLSLADTEQIPAFLETSAESHLEFYSALQ